MLINKKKKLEKMSDFLRAPGSQMRIATDPDYLVNNIKLICLRMNFCKKC